MLTPLFRIETLTGQPIKVKGTQLRVRSQVVQLRLPVIPGGLIWNRPTAVLVQAVDGQDRLLPIPDLTRTAVLALTMLGLATAFLVRLLRRKIN